MATTILVISDMHLGGEIDFQMCSVKGRARLAKFLDWATEQKTHCDNLKLVLNGDVVDFLAERDDDGGFSAFAGDQEEAARKFRRIADGCEPVFAALRRYISSGASLTILLGNHDIELSLPVVRKAFLSRLSQGDVEVLFDNEAYSYGPVLIEHGNRYDAWNMVNHNQLRQIRSQCSRREPPPQFTTQPGSELVARVMNLIKQKFAFVDLLKPETGGVVPILAVLDPGLWKRTGPALKQSIAAWYRGRFVSEGIPKDSDYVAATNDASVLEANEGLPAHFSAPFTVADELISQLLSGDDLISLRRDVAVHALLKAFRIWREKEEDSFGVDCEGEEYLVPARALASRGFKVVVFGHTHLPKRIELENGAVYLNSGTWADLMRLPPDIYAGSEKAGIDALKRFLEQVEKNEIDGFRRQVATFARIDLDSRDDVCNAGVFFFDDDGQICSLSTDGLKERLA